MTVETPVRCRGRFGRFGDLLKSIQPSQPRPFIISFLPKFEIPEWQTKHANVWYKTVLGSFSDFWLGFCLQLDVLILKYMFKTLRPSKMTSVDLRSA